jgi:hypothetical protein
MKRYWIKLWVELISDPKMGRLSDHLWRRAIETFLLAGEHNNDGLLPNLMDMAYYLHTDEDKLEVDLDELLQAGLLEVAPGGLFKVKNFAKRQDARTNTERVQMYRDRQRSMSETSLEREGNEEETEKKRDDDSYVSSLLLSSVSVSDSVFESNFGVFLGDREKKRWIALFEAVGEVKAKQIAEWAFKKQIHMTNRGGLLDSMETAGKTWGEKGKAKTGHVHRGAEVEAAVAAFKGGRQ